MGGEILKWENNSSVLILANCFHICYFGFLLSWMEGERGREGGGGGGDSP